MLRIKIPAKKAGRDILDSSEKLSSWKFEKRKRRATDSAGVDTDSNDLLRLAPEKTEVWGMLQHNTTIKHNIRPPIVVTYESWASPLVLSKSGIRV